MCVFGWCCPDNIIPTAALAVGKHFLMLLLLLLLVFVAREPPVLQHKNTHKKKTEKTNTQTYAT